MPISRIQGEYLAVQESKEVLQELQGQDGSVAQGYGIQPERMPELVTSKGRRNILGNEIRQYWITTQHAK